MQTISRGRLELLSLFFFASAFYSLTTALCVVAQNQQGKLGQQKTQKLANPLNDLLNDAQAALDKNDFAAAVSPLQKFLAEKPDVAFAHFQLAYAYTGLHQDDEARAEYAKCVALDPKMGEGHLNLGILLLAKDAAEAARSLRKAVELLPGQSRPRFLLGVALERAGDLSGAAEAFESASTLDSADEESLQHLGNVLLQLKRPGDAEKKFRLLLDHDATSPGALCGLGLSLELQNKPEALDAYRNYLAVQAQDTAIRARFVKLLFANKNYDEALAESEKLSAGQAPNLDALRLRADIMIAQNKFDEAAQALQQAIAMAPKDAQLHGGLGRLYLQKRDFPNAERELKTAIQIDQGNVLYWKDLAATYYQGGNYASALAVYDAVDKVEKPGVGEWFIRALCYDKLDQVQPALDAYRKFLDLDQNQHADQVWQANQRIHVLENRAEKKK